MLFDRVGRTGDKLMQLRVARKALGPTGLGGPYSIQSKAATDVVSAAGGSALLFPGSIPAV